MGVRVVLLPLPFQLDLCLFCCLVKGVGGADFAVDGAAECVVEGGLVGVLFQVGGGGGDAAGHLLGKALEDGVDLEDARVLKERRPGRYEGGRVRTRANGPDRHTLRCGEALDPLPGRVLVLASGRD
ncbi:MAG: hypothetical protein QOF01_576 [Thermomicrobiales bacterium]|nr:hypothetical protein [Thermomicrobiales bacterium]